MSAITWVLISDPLAKEWSGDPAGLHLVEPGPYSVPGLRWWRLHDEGADYDTYDGRRVEYVVGMPEGEVKERRLMD